MDGDKVFVKCMRPLRKKEKGDPAPDMNRPSKKGSIYRLRSTFGDIFSPQDEAKIRAVREDDLDGASSTGEALKLADALADLEEERAKTKDLQRQLDVAMNLNTELKLSAGLIAEEIVIDEQRHLFSLKMKFKEERKARTSAEAKAAATSKENERLRSAIEAGRLEKKQLEAELLEAAYDVLQNQKLVTALQEARQSGEDSQRVADSIKAETSDLKGKLKRSEETRRQLDKELTHLRAEASKWEDVLDTLQNQLDQALIKPDELPCPAPKPSSKHAASVASKPEIRAVEKPSTRDAPRPECMNKVGRKAAAEGITEWCDRKTEGIMERLACTLPEPSSGAHAPALMAA